MKANDLKPVGDDLPTAGGEAKPTGKSIDSLQPVGGGEDPKRDLAIAKHNAGVTKSQDLDLKPVGDNYNAEVAADLKRAQEVLAENKKLQQDTSSKCAKDDELKPIGDATDSKAELTRKFEALKREYPEQWDGARSMYTATKELEAVLKGADPNPAYTNSRLQTLEEILKKMKKAKEDMFARWADPKKQAAYRKKSKEAMKNTPSAKAFDDSLSPVGEDATPTPIKTSNLQTMPDGPSGNAKYAADADPELAAYAKACNLDPEDIAKHMQKDPEARKQFESWKKSKGKDKSKANDSVMQHSGSAPEDHLKRGMQYEVGQDKARALDAYRAAATGFRNSGDRREDQARAGIDSCQRSIAASYDGLYAHPNAGKAKVCDSADSALRTALERTRSGETVHVVGATVRPGVARANDESFAELKQRHGDKYSDDVLKRAAASGREPWSINPKAKDEAELPPAAADKAKAKDSAYDIQPV